MMEGTQIVEERRSCGLVGKSGFNRRDHREPTGHTDDQERSKHSFSRKTLDSPLLDPGQINLGLQRAFVFMNAEYDDFLMPPPL
jgi:hypothetical protein